MGVGGYTCKDCRQFVNQTKDSSPYYPYCYECYRQNKKANDFCECITLGQCTCGIEGDKEDHCNLGCCAHAGEYKDDSCNIF